MNCRQAQRLIHAFMDDELAPGQQEALEAHLASCTECKESTGQFRAMVEGFDWLAQETESVPVILDSGRSIRRQAVAGEPARWRVPAQRWGMIPLGAAAVITLMLMWLPHQPERAKPSADGVQITRAARHQPAPHGGSPELSHSSETSPFTFVLTGTSRDRYIAVQQKTDQPRVHIVWLHGTVSTHEDGQSLGTHMQLARSS